MRLIAVFLTFYISSSFAEVDLIGACKITPCNITKINVITKNEVSEYLHVVAVHSCYIDWGAKRCNKGNFISEIDNLNNYQAVGNQFSAAINQELPHVFGSYQHPGYALSKYLGMDIPIEKLSRLTPRDMYKIRLVKDSGEFCAIFDMLPPLAGHIKQCGTGQIENAITYAKGAKTFEDAVKIACDHYDGCEDRVLEFNRIRTYKVNDKTVYQVLLQRYLSGSPDYKFEFPVVDIDPFTGVVTGTETLNKYPQHNW